MNATAERACWVVASLVLLAGLCLFYLRAFASLRTLHYIPDLKSMLDADCVGCHSTSRPQGGYDLTHYAGIMKAVCPGDPTSPLVVTTARGGSMRRHFSGDPAFAAELIREWVVSGAAERRFGAPAPTLAPVIAAGEAPR